MVDIIIISDAVLKMNVIVNGSKNVFLRNMLRDQIVDISSDHTFHLIDISGGFLNNSRQDRIIHLLCHAYFFRVNINDCLKVYHHVGKDFDISGSILSFNPQESNCRILNRIRDLTGDLCTFFSHNLSCQRTYHILCEDTSVYAVSKHQLLIEFIASYFRQIITSRVKEHAVDQTLRAVHCKGLARTDLFIQL